MTFTQEEIKNLELLLQSPVEDNIRLAFAILEGKEYPTAIKNLVDEYKELYKILYPNDDASLEEMYISLKNLKELNLYSRNLEEIPNILSQLTNLETLGLSRDYDSGYPNPSVDDLSPLIFLNNLKELDLSYCDFEEIPGELNQLTNLEILDLSGNFERTYDIGYPRIYNFSPLISLKNLKELKLENCGLLEIPEALIYLTNLELLDLSNNFEWGRIKCSDESGYKKLHGFLPLIFLEKLKDLCLSNCNLKEISIDLSSLEALETLNLSNNNLAKANFTSLESLKNLEILYLNNCKLTRIPVALEKLTSLKGVDLSKNDLSKADFSPLLSLKNLGELNIENCKIEELPSALLELKNKGVLIRI